MTHPRPMKVLLAFDKFKGSLSASEACEAAAVAVRDVLPDANIELAPLTDGGEGFVDLLTACAQGQIEVSTVSDPGGQPVDARWGIVSVRDLPAPARDLLRLPRQGDLAIVEMAQASGLQLLEERRRDPWQTTTRGVGQVLNEAARRRPAAILLGIGGSATHDLGLGALQELGLKSHVSREAPLPDPAPVHWDQLTGFSGQIEPGFPPIIIASDVDNPLLGARGAARVYACQKGLPPGDVERLDQLTSRAAQLLCRHFNRDPKILEEPGSGAAGGIGAGLRIACGARMISGFSLVCSWMDLDRKLVEAECILTGEGSFDSSSVEGKGPGTLVHKALRAGKKTFVFAGRVDLPERLRRNLTSCSFFEISPRDWPLEKITPDAANPLRKSVEEAVKKNLK